jgi:hypothetical protein
VHGTPLIEDPDRLDIVTRLGVNDGRSWPQDACRPTSFVIGVNGPRKLPAS